MTIGLIWAQAANRTIGRDGTLPWRLPEDLAHFRAVTAGSSVIMGRRTWASLPERFRPLPGRRNLVLTRSPSWAADGATAVGSLGEALAAAQDDVWVIGGASVYAEALASADRVEITELADAFAGDVVAPELDARWQRVAVDPAEGWHTSSTGLAYRFSSYAVR